MPPTENGINQTGANTLWRNQGLSLIASAGKIQGAAKEGIVLPESSMAVIPWKSVSMMIRGMCEARAA